MDCLRHPRCLKYLLQKIAVRDLLDVEWNEEFMEAVYRTAQLNSVYAHEVLGALFGGAAAEALDVEEGDRWIASCAGEIAGEIVWELVTARRRDAAALDALMYLIENAPPMFGADEELDRQFFKAAETLPRKALALLCRRPDVPADVKEKLEKRVGC